MRLALCLIPFLLWADSAFPGPAVAVAVAWVATHYIAVQIALTVAMAVYGAAQQRKKARRAAEKARRDFNASLQDRTVTAVSSEMPHVYIYGRARVGSAVVALFPSGPKDEYKWLVCEHAAHECDGFEEIYINGKPLGPLDANGDVTSGDYAVITTERAGDISTLTAGEPHTGASFNLLHTPVPGTLTLSYDVTTGTQPYNVTVTRVNVPYTIVGTLVTPTGYAGNLTAFYQWKRTVARVRVLKHLGAPGQTVDTALQAAVGAVKWPNTATLDGLCYTVIRLDLNQPEFQNGIPSIEPVIRGKKLYDPRTALTVWSQNNSLAIMDYVTSEMCGVEYADLPESAYITAANVCDEVLADGLPRYTMNGSVSADHDQEQVLQDMAESMAGTIVRTTWDVVAGKYIAPVAAYTQADIVGNLAVNPGLANSDLFNGVRGQAITAANSYVPTDFEPFKNAVYLAEDNGEEKWDDHNYPFTDTKQRIHNLARISLEDARNGFTLKGDFSLKVWPRKIGDRFTYTSTFLGQVDKIYRITDKRYTPGGVIELSIKEDAPSIWDQADAVVADETPNTNYKNPFLIDPLVNLTAESGTNALLIQQDGSIISRIHLTWDQTTNQAVYTNGIIEVEWYQADSAIPHKSVLAGYETDTYLIPVEDGRQYDVRARVVNQYLNVKSDWAYIPLHTVVGKTEPPASVFSLQIDGDTLTWPEVTDADLAGYFFRFQYGTNTDWGTATALHEGFVTESPWTPKSLPFGAVTIMGKAVDTSGNESLITANVFTDLGDPLVTNEVMAYEFDPTYPGTRTNCTVTGGDLVAGTVDSFYGDDAASFYGSDAESFYEPTAFGQMIYTSGEVSMPLVLPGSRLVLEIETQGDGVLIEYRSVAPAAFYGTGDTDPFYGTSDADSFYGADDGEWLVWPGQIAARSDVLQFRVTIAGGTIQGKIIEMRLILDALNIIEAISDLPISSSGTAIPYLSPFTHITSIQATLQANLSGAETIETDKSVPLTPTAKAYNSAHVAVDGATADFIIQGY